MLFRLISLHSFIYNTPRYARKRSHQRSYFIHSFTKAVTVHGPGTRSQEGGQLSRHTSHTFTKAAAALPSSRGVKRAHPRPDSQTRIRDANPYGKGSGSETVQPTLHSQHTQTGTSHLIHSQHVNTQRRSPLVGHTSHSRHVGKDSKTLITPHCSFTTHQHAKRTRHVNFPSRQVKSNRSAIKKRHAFENV